MLLQEPTHCHQLLTTGDTSVVLVGIAGRRTTFLSSQQQTCVSFLLRDDVQMEGADRRVAGPWDYGRRALLQRRGDGRWSQLESSLQPSLVDTASAATPSAASHLREFIKRPLSCTRIIPCRLRASRRPSPRMATVASAAGLQARNYSIDTGRGGKDISARLRNRLGFHL